MQKLFDRNVFQNCITTLEDSVCLITEREQILGGMKLKWVQKRQSHMGGFEVYFA